MSHSLCLCLSLFPPSSLPPSSFCVFLFPPPHPPTPTSNYSSVCNGSGSLQHYSILNSRSLSEFSLCLWLPQETASAVRP